MSQPDPLEGKLRELLGEDLISYSRIEARRVFVEVPRDRFKVCMERMVHAFNIAYIVTITGVDLGEELELIYHLWCEKENVLISVRVKLPKEAPHIETVTDLLPGAVLYEREVFDMLGVIFEGHPDLRRLLLPEDWPEGVHPLRKDVSLEKLREIMLGRGVK